MHNQGPLVICGAGGHGRVVASTARAAGWSGIVFLDPKWPTLPFSGEWPVEGDGNMLARDVAGRLAIAGIGDNRRRMQILDVMARECIPIATVLHPTAWLCPSVIVGEGCVVMAHAAVNHSARLERGVIVNTQAVVEHDCVLGAGAHISPGAVLAGNVSVGPLAFVGAGVSVIQGIRIGAGAVIGAGAAVVSDVPEGETWAGVPARQLRASP